ncbi:cyanophycin synthetase [Chitinimonas lacunae]|uniref:Cyanophycin synthetase n=1 Tax=Chitinimonas lacunae TaxID=1963018 RepID=A0ABV8MT10_9NEIS
MKIVDTRFLRGPNLHSPRPCFMAVLDLEELDEVPSTAIFGFTERLCALIPSLSEHRCSTGYRGGFVDRLKEGTYMAHITEHVLIELQCLAGSAVGFGKARMLRGQPRHYRIVCSYHIEQLVEAALPVAVDLVCALARGEDYDLESQLVRLRELVADYGLGPSTGAVVEAARARGIPVMRLTDTASLFQLGWGARQRRIQATITGLSSHIAVEIASNKQLTKTLLEQAGVPVPRGSLVSSVSDAVVAAQRLHGPVTVKPLDANHGRGVTTCAITPEEVAQAFEQARQHSRRVIVEQFIEGDDYRVLVIKDQVVAAARRRPPCVVGDGVRTIRELIKAENLDPRRGDGHCKTLTLIPLDSHTEGVLARQGFDFETVLNPGQMSVLRGNANLSTGGTAEDVTDLLPAVTRAACVRAAQTVGLDVAGIDLICRDIEQPLNEQRGAVIEVNAAPGIRMHEWPSSGVRRAVGAAIVDSLFEPGQDGRIPLIAVTGTNGKTTTVLLIARALRESGLTTGYTTTEGVFINGECLRQGDCSGYWSARTVLAAPEVEAAVLETARGGILKRGLAFDRCDVSVVLNVTADHLGQDGIETLGGLADVKAVVAHTASRVMVLNADDRYCREMAEERADGIEVVYFSMEADSPVIAAHIAQGGRAVVLLGDRLVVWGGRERLSLPVAQMPFTLGGLARHNIANALAATAALIAIDCPTEAIVAALTAFRSDVEENPLRLNLLKAGNNVSVLVDYAHNAASYRALIETARACSTSRVIGVISAPGDRRDHELYEVGQICGEGFDEVVVYEMDDRRGRGPGSLAEVVRAGARIGAGDRPVNVVLDVRAALRYGLQCCRPGDLLVYGCANDIADLTQVLAEPRPVEPLPLNDDVVEVDFPVQKVAASL